METEVEVVDLHLLDVDQGEDELVVHVLQQVGLQPGQQLPDHILHHPVGEVTQPAQHWLVTGTNLEHHLLLTRGLGSLPGTGKQRLFLDVVHLRLDGLVVQTPAAGEQEAGHCLGGHLV